MNAAKTNNGFTALMAASFHGHLHAVQALLGRGASKTAASTSGQTAYDLATGKKKAALRAILKP